MSNHLKKWWERRKEKHYLKSHWHLFADIALVTIIIALVVGLIIILDLPKQKVDTSSVEHVSKITASTTSDSLVVKTSVDKDSIYSGDSFVLHLNLENQGNINLTNITLSPTFSSNDFTIKEIKNDTVSSAVSVKNNKLSLAKLATGETVSVDLSVAIKAEVGSPRAIKWQFKGTYQEANLVYNNNYSLNTIKLISDLKVTAEAYYNSQLGDQLGSGPIPPMLGLPTNYWVFFEADGNENDLSNLTVTAKIPDGVTLAKGRTLSAGTFSYDESQKRVTWTVKDLSADNSRYQLGFEVQLFPTAKQVGTNPDLLNNITYLAIDSYTGEKLSGKLLNINTDLPFDAINQGQGRVLK